MISVEMMTSVIFDALEQRSMHLIMITDDITAYLVVSCRLILIVVFLFSAYSKLRDFSTFRTTIVRFNIVPEPSSHFVALSVLTAEILTIVLLSSDRSLLMWGFLLGGGLLTVFSIALYSTLVRKIKTSCNCFGSSEQVISKHDLWRNLGFIVCALLGLTLASTTKALENSLNLVEWLFVSFITVSYVVLCMNLREISELMG